MASNDQQEREENTEHRQVGEIPLDQLLAVERRQSLRNQHFRMRLNRPGAREHLPQALE
jgi:hypothetical protein